MRIIGFLQLKGDEVGVKFEDGNVIVPESMKEATNVVIEGGLTQLFGHQEYGGMEFPNVINVPIRRDVMCSKHVAWNIFRFN